MNKSMIMMSLVVGSFTFGINTADAGSGQRANRDPAGNGNGLMNVMFIHQTQDGGLVQGGMHGMTGTDGALISTHGLVTDGQGNASSGSALMLNKADGTIGAQASHSTVTYGTGLQQEGNLAAYSPTYGTVTSQGSLSWSGATKYGEATRQSVATGVNGQSYRSQTNGTATYGEGLSANRVSDLSTSYGGSYHADSTLTAKQGEAAIANVDSNFVNANGAVYQGQTTFTAGAGIAGITHTSSCTDANGNACQGN